MKILLVDDDPISRAVVNDVLIASGNEVTTAASGEAAIKAVEAAESLDMILMDMRMPGGMDGQEATTRIKAMPGWRGHVRIVAMSAGEIADRGRFDGALAKGSPDFGASLAAAVAEGLARLQPAVTVQPPRATLVGWIRLNLALMIFAMSLVTGGLGMLVAGTVRVARYDTRLEALEAARPEIVGPRVAALEEAARHDTELQARQEQERRERDARRLQLATDLGAINARLGVLESQSKWLSDYITTQIRRR